MLSSSSEISVSWHHIFVDLENVPSVNFLSIGQQSVTYTLLLGAKQARRESVLAEALIGYPGTVHLVRLTSSGKNALDLALAYYVGRAAVLDPSAHFHIVSKDLGFSPLIEHLKSCQIEAFLHSDFSNLSFSGPVKPTSPLPEPPLQRALEHLRRNPANRPKSEKNLIRHFKSLLGKGTSETEALLLITSLKHQAILQIADNGSVTYHLPPAPLLPLPEQENLGQDQASR